MGVGRCSLARRGAQVGNDPDHDVVAAGLDAIVGGLSQGQYNARSRTAPFIFTDARANQSDSEGACIHGNFDVAQAGCTEVHHDPRRLFELPGRKRGPRRGRYHDRRVTPCLGDVNGAHLRSLGMGRCGEPGAHEDAEHDRGFPARVGSPPALLAAHHRGRVWEPFEGSHIIRRHWLTGHFSAPSGLTRMAFSKALVSPPDVISANSNTTRSDRILVTRADDLET